MISKKIKESFYLFLFLIILLISISNISAVEGNFTNLQTEIDNAPVASTIDLTGNVMVSGNESSNFTNGIKIDKNDLTINGNGFTIDGNNTVRIFNITGNNVKLINLKIIGGYNDTYAGAIYNTGNNLNIINSSFLDNSATSGGAIYNKGSDFKIYDSVFSFNNAMDGGAILNRAPNFRIYDSNFYNNTGNWGGAIYNTGSHFYILNTGEFIGNRAAFGGVIYNYDYDFDFITHAINSSNDGAFFKMEGTFNFLNNYGLITDSKGPYGSGGALSICSSDAKLIGNFTFKSNTGRAAGAVYIESDNALFSGIFSFIDNYALEVAGTIFNNNKDLTFDGDFLFLDNQVQSGEVNGSSENRTNISGQIEINAFTGGGAIFNSNANLYIKNARFINNTCITVYGGGGAIMNRGGNITIIDSIFEGNLVKYLKSSEDKLYGGAIFNLYVTISSKDRPGNLTIINSNFTSNSNVKEAGAIYNYKSESFIYSSNFIDNSGNFGGAVYNYQSNITIYDSTFLQNKVSSSGSVLYSSHSNSTIYNSLFEDNNASASSTVVNVNGTLNVYNSDFLNNYVRNNGGALWNYNGTTTVEDSTFINNYAGANGGAIYISNGLVNLANSYFLDNNGNQLYISATGASYLNNNNFSASKSAIFNRGTITSLTYMVILDNDTINTYAGNSVNLTAILNDDNGNIIIGSVVNFNCDNFTQDTVTYTSTGVYYTSFTPEGEENYLINGSVRGLNNIIIKTGIVHIINVIVSDDVILYYRNGSRFEIQLIDKDGNYLAGKQVTFLINNNLNERTTDLEGKASLAINLNPGTYPITISYNDDVLAIKTNITNYITVIQTVTSNDIVKYYRNDTQYYVIILDGKGNPIANTDVTMNINGVFYTRTSDASGNVRLSINLNPNTYVITVIHPSDGLEWSNTILVLATINGSDISKYYKNGTQYQVKVLDSRGNALTNTDVTMNINGVFYTRKSNSEGIVTLSINLNPNTYIITVTHPLDGSTFSNQIKVLATLSGKNLVTSQGAGDSYEITLLDGRGNPYSSQNITMNINGVFYQRTTSSDGIARLTINLNPGHYTITAVYDGYSTSNSIRVNQ